MADEEEPEDVEAEEGEESQAEEASDGAGKKKLLIIIGLILLLVVGGLAGAYFTGLLDPVIEILVGGDPSKEGEDEQSSEADLDKQAVFYDLEEILVNLNSGGRKSSFLKIRISLELNSDEDIPRLENVMPRVIDNFQVYLRELRIDDLKGSAGMYRLREELLRRVSAATAPVKIKDVLFKEMLVQ